MPKRTNRSELIDQLLQEIATRQLTADDALKPDVTHKLLPDKLEHEQLQTMRSALRYVKYNQLVLRQKSGFLSVTTKAKKRLEKLEIEHIIVSKPKKWDKKWRLILFEIPSDKKTQRDAFARKLKQLGFKNLQDSVFIYPYPCRTEVEKIADYYGLSNFVTYVEATDIKTQTNLAKAFKSLL